MYVIVTLKGNEVVDEARLIRDARTKAEDYRRRHGKAVGIKLKADHKPRY